MDKTKKEFKLIYSFIIIFFLLFLLVPLFILVFDSFRNYEGFTLSNYTKYLSDKVLLRSIKNSVSISFLNGIIVTFIAFILAYGMNFSNMPKRIKKLLNIVMFIPMLLPTITYGFAIIYSFGKQGLLTKIFNRELFEIYGPKGLLIGYMIYTLPTAYLLINNSFRYIDKKFLTVSNLMGDSKFRTIKNTVIRPLIGSIGCAFVLSFILSFTDFGIPAAVGGNFEVVSTTLYQVMLGAIPDFNGGAAIAIIMLIPALFGIILLNYLERFNFNYDKISDIELKKNNFRDIGFSIISLISALLIFGVFLVMFISPFMKNFPYDMTFTLDHVKSTLTSNNLIETFRNSIVVSLFSGVFGVTLAYLAAVLNTRSNLKSKPKGSIDSISIITNTVPGMVLGLAYLLLFNKSSLKGSLILIIVCNIVHFFAAPYLMAKGSLSKLNKGFETTGELMGDSFFKTLYRVIIPNSFKTIVEMFSYYFINSMVTISAIIFLVGSKSAVITTKIKELQHYAKFNEIFILSILIFLTNLFVKLICEFYQNKKDGV